MEENKPVETPIEGKVLLGDCLELMMDIPANSIDMILCDLPYGTTQCKWDIVIPFERLWLAYSRIIKNNGAIILTASQPFTSALIMSNPKMFKHEWVWNKVKPSNFLNARKEPLKQHESIIVFSKGSVYYNPIKTKGKLRDKQPKRKIYTDSVYQPEINKGVKNINDELYPKSIIEFSNANQKNRLHPTQKPVSLFEYLIKTYTHEGMTVLDNCAGSGTTAIACINTNRNYICIEKDENYFNIINERIINHAK